MSDPLQQSRYLSDKTVLYADADADDVNACIREHIPLPLIYSTTILISKLSLWLDISSSLTSHLGTYLPLTCVLYPSIPSTTASVPPLPPICPLILQHCNLSITRCFCWPDLNTADRPHECRSRVMQRRHSYMPVSRRSSSTNCCVISARCLAANHRDISGWDGDVASHRERELVMGERGVGMRWEGLVVV